MSFDVLNRQQLVQGRAILEASAGTGKTFAIENIVLRLLIEKGDQFSPLPLDKILVVTFTRAATRDLKERIRKNLERSLDLLKDALQGESLDESCPDFLLAHIEKGKEEIQRIKKLVHQALRSFENAQIFTIHGFCWHMLNHYALEAEMSMETGTKEDRSLQKTLMLQAIRDFLRTELKVEKYSPKQLEILLRKADGQIEKLQEALLKIIEKGMEIISPPPFSQLFDQFKLAMATLRQRCIYDAEQVVDDFISQSAQFNGLYDKKKQLHLEALEKVQRFANVLSQSAWEPDDFDLLIEEGLFLLEAFDPAKRSKRSSASTPPILHYPDLLEEIKIHLEPIVLQARNEGSLFARLASDCQRFIRHYQVQEELLDDTQLIIQMEQTLNKPAFVSKIRETYAAAIIDEFQDTDPLQWQLFKTLFMNPAWMGHFYLVGDPKQSIYAFRQADIYTYLSAVHCLGENALATLDTNFRSLPSLVASLNTLFSGTPGMFSLPRHSNSLAYRDVKAGKNEHKEFSDNLPNLQFWMADSESLGKISLKEVESLFFFPEMAKELIRLKQSEGINFGQCAILVADRFQSERVKQYLKAANIPAKDLRGDKLSQSLALTLMRELLIGITAYKKQRSLKTLLGNRLIGLTHQEMGQLNQEDFLEKIYTQCDQLREVFLKEGFAPFYFRFMESRWHEDQKSVLERLLSEEDGYEFYCEWQEMADLLIFEQTNKNLSVDSLIAFLDEFDVLSDNDDERLKIHLDPEEEGVTILTIHASKGLEFEIVFPLGLIKPSKSPFEELIPLDQCLMAPLDKEDVHYKTYCEELDAEKMRQLYVALTRAKYRLYVPIFPKPKQLESGTASPMELFLARLNQPETSHEGLYERIRNNDYRYEQFFEKHTQKMLLKKLLKNEHSFSFEEKASIPSLIAPKDVEMPGLPLFMQSFTSLTKNIHKPPESKEEVMAAPADYNIAIKTAHTLPSNNETGILLHRIFEYLSFSAPFLNPESLLPTIRPYIANSPFAPWETVIADLVFQALNTPLPIEEKPFCLKDIDPKKIYREIDFLYPSTLGVNQGYLKGTIDLIFEHDNRYYMLDWKSNWLGPSSEAYTHTKMEQAMQQNQYDLQADIYAEALYRYFKLFDQRPFEELFGGVFYLFLRGIESNTGIYHFFPKILAISY